MASRIDELEGLVLDEPQGAKNALHALAASGDADAAFVLALAYYDGEFGDRDVNECVALLEQAAAKDHVRALHDLGCFRYYGYGFEPEFQDTQEAIVLLSRGAKLGYPPSQYFLAKLILSGEAASWGNDQAMALIRAAASQGHEESIDYLAKIDSGAT